ncbi:glucose-6-phosphate 1-dehydrogenase [Pseudoclavibacter endophyticus]|uniref:Glucose-6-phosphate dehydrogenase n=1 Tax=Pseudoclavibacter endophyticus TaxID=1778590 RepID=A0A6H9WIW7_9MICO|nr:glucose-6-phosphate dehydrogenase [Pseudoclavibacter endophyticus]KAB1646753.1 glucose-6-phosphate dehydrogenase [Pseudoclavibacter endophyticus]GGA75865.1 glucose-6-phosphate 1-dehydrogenase [Pseudoclavibacter endophyticus]
MTTNPSPKFDPSPQFVILGAWGDLASRLLLPGLASLIAHRSEFAPRLLGVGRAPDGEGGDSWSALVRVKLESAGEERAERAAAQAEYVQCDLLDEYDVRALVDRLETGCVLYFALPPSVTGELVELLARTGVPEGTRLALEKPIGTSESAARELNAAAQRLVPEDRIFRVDHFLGNALVLNVLGVRFANQVFEPLWNRTYVERVEIVYDEDLTVEGRGDFYDGTGALVDMLQSHLLLVSAIVCMDEPSRIDPVEFRDLMAHALRAMRVYDGDPVASSRRARYTAGRIGDREVPDYTDEPGVDGRRGTETLAEVTLEVRSQRWAGVPIVLRSGKALGRQRRVIRLLMRPVPVVPVGLAGEAAPNVLELDLGTGDFTLGVVTSAVDDPQTLDRAVLRARLGRSALTPYGEVLEMLIDGDPLLSVRDDVSERCWAIVQPVRDAWASDAVPLETYAAGTDGPGEWSTSAG